MILVCRTQWLSRIAFQEKRSNDKLRLRKITRVISRFCFNQYDVIFAFSIILSCGTLSCRWIQGKEEIDRLSNITYSIFASEYDTVANLIPVSTLKHVSFMNDSITCLDTRDLFIKISGVILFISSIILKFVYIKIQKVQNSPLLT